MPPIAITDSRLIAAPAEDVGRVAGVVWLCAHGIASPRRAALAMASCRGRVLLIADGTGIAATDRALTAWTEVVAARASRLLLFGPGADGLAERLAAAGHAAMVVRCSDVGDAAQAAAHLASRGSTVLLALPARPSRLADDTAARFRAAVDALAMAERPVEVA